jgi:acetolactate synthase-1/2/3 large subunit
MVSSPLEDLWPFLDRDEFLANMLVAPIDAD